MKKTSYFAIPMLMIVPLFVAVAVRISHPSVMTITAAKPPIPMMYPHHAQPVVDKANYFVADATPVEGETERPFVLTEEDVIRMTPPVASYTYRDANVQRWYPLARYVGWEDKDWKFLSCVIYRESRGNESAKNKRSSARGLTQVMWSVHKKRVTALFGGDSSILYDPYVNLFIAHLLYLESGKSPWRTNGIKSC